MSWPAMAYVYGTWGYALERANEHARERQQRVRLYQAGRKETVIAGWNSCLWVVDWEVQDGLKNRLVIEPPRLPTLRLVNPVRSGIHTVTIQRAKEN